MTAPTVAFYAVADERFFLGAVAMLNSLRLLGHDEPLYVCDCGLTERQRELLAPHATLVPAPSNAAPTLLKSVAPLRHPADVMVLIDADIIATRRLDDLVATASEGRVVAVEHGTDRFVPEWGELLDLGPVRRQAYLSCGLLVLDGSLGKRILKLMADRQDRVDFEQTFWRRNVADYPFLYGDQCLLNAIFSSRVESERIVALDRRLEAIPPFEGLRVIDDATLRCAYEDGLEPYAIHHYTVKPWLEGTLYGVYTQLLVRLLRGRDVTIRMRRLDLPPHLRMGVSGYATNRLEAVLGRTGRHPRSERRA